MTKIDFTAINKEYNGSSRAYSVAHKVKSEERRYIIKELEKQPLERLRKLVQILVNLENLSTPKVLRKRNRYGRLDEY